MSFISRKLISLNEMVSDWVKIIFPTPAPISISSIISATGSTGANFVAADTGRCWISSDGITWQSNTGPSSNSKTLQYGSNKYVLLINDYDTNIGYYSTDAINWTQTTLPVSRVYRSIAYSGTRFVATCNSQDGSDWLYSDNGITWSTSQNPSGSGSALAYGGGKFVANLGSVDPFSSTRIAYSSNGITWQTVTLPFISEDIDITYGDGKFVIVIYRTQGGGTNKSFYSSDAITWQESILPFQQLWKNVEYGNGKFIATGNSQYGAYSNDGIIWTKTIVPLNMNLVTYGFGKFIGGGFGKDLYYIT